MNVELRRIEIHDLDAVDEIEQASYPTPWSRSMFAAELQSQARSRSGRTASPAASSGTSSSRDMWTRGT